MAGQTTAEPAAAFMANYQAVRLFRLDRYARLQLFRSLAKAHAAGVRVEPEAADLVWSISEGAAPRQAGLLLARLSYLIRSGRCARQCAEIANTLVRTAPRVSKVGEYLRAR